jgi:DNA-binding transcriptional ArsR family regulator
LAENKPYQEETLPLPPGIEESLCQGGGIEGLLERLPDGETLEKPGIVYKALADPMRLKILVVLAVQPLCVCVMKAVLGIADSKLSYHLSVPKKAGLIVGDQQGNWIIYNLTNTGAVWAGRIDVDQTNVSSAAETQWHKRQLSDHCNYSYGD